MDAAWLGYVVMQPDKVSGGRLLEEDDGISIGACRRMVCRRIATSVWNPLRFCKSCWKDIYKVCPDDSLNSFIIIKSKPGET